MGDKGLVNIIELCKKRDSGAQKQLYKLFYNYSMTICSRYAADNEEAKEILNDGFFKVLTKIDLHTGEQPFKGWLNKIMVNSAIDHYRKQQRNIETVELLPSTDGSFDGDALTNLSVQEIMKMIQELTPSYRMVFTLYSIEGYRHHEIADKLRISVGASKSNLSKARAKLQEKILAVNAEGKIRKYAG